MNNKIKHILDKIEEVKIGIYGDFCIDFYMFLDPKGSEVSVETGHRGESAESFCCNLGGASNIVQNIAAMKPGKIMTVGVIGNDVFGREIIKKFNDLRVDIKYLVTQESGFNTYTYIKRYLDETELPRIDIGFNNHRSLETDMTILKGIENILVSCDAFIFNQQIPGSINNDFFIKKINEIFKNNWDKIIILDSRHYGDRIKYAYRKTNDFEAYQLVNEKKHENNDIENLKDCARKLYEMYEKPLFITRGPLGMITFDDNGFHKIEGINIKKKIDPVGAGDTVTSLLALCLGCGEKPEDAAYFANIGASVTVQKVFGTGAVTPEEILLASEDIDFIYNPELAQDRRKAEYFKKSEIEICSDFDFLTLRKIKHVLFDHDGTISTLRQGWEKIMEEIMIKCILGKKYLTADMDIFERVRERVISYIEASTGVQTIIQMEALVDIIREFQIVSEDEILDKYEYKKIYNRELMKIVNKNIAKLQNKEFDTLDFTIKNAVNFLKDISGRGVKLYLASGTDVEDAINESKMLGYYDLFEGRVYGALNDISRYSKKIIINNIITDNNLAGPELAIFGDGPVEVRECRKRGGIAIGVASDEIRRYGINQRKRTRLIKAGAHIIIPDFSQAKTLLEILF